jgi:hypothetical protein
MRRIMFLSLAVIGLGSVWGAAPAVAGDHKAPSNNKDERDPVVPTTPVVRDHRTPKPGPVVRDHRQPAPGPIIRDHRTPNQGPIVRDHRTEQGPIIRDHRTPQSGPIVRDHRPPTYTVPTYAVPTSRPPVVNPVPVNTVPVRSPYQAPKWQDASNASGGVVVTQSPVVNRPHNSQHHSTKRPTRPSTGSSLPIPRLPIVVRLPF